MELLVKGLKSALNDVLYISSAENAGYYELSSSSAIYSDASYVRLKNLSVSYQITGALLKRLHSENFQIYLLGQNLFTLTKYKVTDPETQNLYVLPPLRTITIGLQSTF